MCPPQPDATDHDWDAALDQHDLGALDPAVGRRMVVVAAHPDDETLGVAGFMCAAHAAGVGLELVVATDGEAALPEHTDLDRDELARRRRAELGTAMSRLGLGSVPVHWLGLPDSRLDAAELAERLEPLLLGADVCVAPWSRDPHRDHAAAGLATARAAPAGARRWQYPIWMWTACSPRDPDIPWSQARHYRLSERERARKEHAVDAYSSQTSPMVEGGRPVLDQAVLRHFRTGYELLFHDETT